MESPTIKIFDTLLSDDMPCLVKGYSMTIIVTILKRKTMMHKLMMSQLAWI